MATAKKVEVTTRTFTVKDLTEDDLVVLRVALNNEIRITRSIQRADYQQIAVDLWNLLNDVERS